MGKEWGNSEWFGMLKYRQGYDDQACQRVKTLCKSSNQAWLVLSLALINIWLLCLFHFLQLDRFQFLLRPEPASLRRVLGLDVMSSYGQLTEAITAMGDVFPEDVCSAIVELM